MTSKFELQDELEALIDLAKYEIPNEQDCSDPGAILQGHAVGAIANSSNAISDPETFDAFRSILKHADIVPSIYMSKVIDAVSSAFLAQIDATTRDEEDQETYVAHKMALDMYAFLVHWFVIAADKVKAEGEDEAPQPAKARRGRGGKAPAPRNAAASRKTNEAWNWADQVPATLGLISKALRLKTHRIWVTTPERDSFISCLTRPAYHIAENEQYMKINAIKMAVYKVICFAVKHNGHALAAQITIMQSLQYYEHLSEPMAECLSILAKEFDHAQLGDEILREIGAKSFSAQDTKGPRAFSKFLVKFSEEAPRSVLKQISLLITHLDSESYPMRMALVEVLGALIRELAMSEEMTTQIHNQLTNLYDLLISRTLDLSSYVRVKVLVTLGKLCDLPIRFPKQRLRITRAAISMLEDKVASVRKGAVSMLVRLVVTHPYGLMHGGHLGLTEWEERYMGVRKDLEKLEGTVGKAVERDEEGTDDDDDEEAPKKKKKTNGDDMQVDSESQSGRLDDSDNDMVDDGNDTEERKPRKSQINMAALASEQEAYAALQTDELLSLRLRRKYYSEALNFIRMLEGAINVVTQLLGSTNKPEVLESMEFFRVTWEYRFDGAEIGIKRMLHLVWSKDNNSTSEDGKELKGVRARLLECYKSLYFEALPDMEPKQQVNRIAKNMIELTYDATLAELTSLEEMMRSMMEDGQIHGDVIAKLWQVYSSTKPLPRSQRRGAIIILGMLALAKRSVVTDKVDTLLRVGLGSFGKADLMLARYTCLALQRLNGSAKKVKGSLLDKTLRIEMGNPIFRKLQEAILHPCRSKDWFGMAEQAVNTIYALGEHPDELCNEIIKILTRRAFERRPQAPEPEIENNEDEEQNEDEESMEKDPDEKGQQMNEDSAPASALGPSSQAGSTAGGNKDLGDVFQLSQLLFIVGHVAIKHIVFLELVEREWKRQKDEKQLAAKLVAGGDTPTTSKDGEELDQVAGNTEDEIGERIAGVREIELLYGPESLLALYGPLLVHVCGSPHKFKNRTLRAAASLSFSKFLCVSSQFCDQHHHLLFKILETSKDPNIRSNIVIALGDVAVSFSNIIDENSNELYKGLSDEDLVVKKNTLMVLTHLILNGMIKVKGQLGEMAKCLEDEEPRIADLAKLFFSELSTKDNAIYNNLPDVISHLSSGEHAVDEEAFQSTMKYIFSFIEKEKQAENIVEKLCQRFRLSEDPRQWRDIAYCLSLLPFKSERSVKKLIEGLQFYRDKLHEPTVFLRFTEILTKARSNKSANKPDSELNEFEAILEEHKRQGEEDQAFEKRVEGKKAAVKKRATRRSNRKKNQQVEPEPEPEPQRQAGNDDDDDDDDDDMYV
ncbi:non-SMC mitotic condensation complex subunit 1-domain-containing protein [Hygrophoropsis aurantiaca]|uniref:Non-SMC mitotic condensation complex subunit 1-domain-containing protein n=1 Tax=Hygrophoropsis aurantiaca TaxID=72124 RepID=A0ACB8AK11_9AGAM|nr:non-SMC mitotic condensation complex subunit 1-domain-containing protein [Hygrophoropsis aurantiaca]